MVEYSYTVLFDPQGSADDVTTDVEVLEVTEVGTGEVTSATIRLNSQLGKYITPHIQLSWTGGSGALDEGDIITTTANGWSGTFIELLSGNSASGTGIFSENNVTFSDVAQTLSGGGWSATYTTSSDVLLNRPIPDQYDRFKVTITDEESNVLTRVYEVDKIVPIQNTEEGTAVEFECLGLEHHMQKIQFAKQFRFESAFDTAEDICDFYNSNRVSANTQPLVVGHTDVSTNGGTGFNDFPKWNSNFYPFGNRYITGYDALIQLADSGGAPVTVGGLGDFWEVFFTRGSDDNEIEFRAFSSGSTGSNITVINALDVNPAENEGGVENFTGNLVKLEGSENGSLPPDYSNFIGKQEVFQQIPIWQDPAVTLQDYPQNARVNFEGTVYVSDIDDNSSTPPTDWTAETFEDFNGTNNDYSIWTKGLDSETINSGSNPAPSKFGAVTGFNQSGVWDSNLVVADEVSWQYPVIQRIRQTSDIDVNYLYNQATAGTHRGMWFLIDTNIGALGSPFNQNGGVDRFGNAYNNRFVRRNQFNFTGSEEYKNWDVIGPLNNSGTVRLIDQDDLAAVMDEGKMYRYDTTNGWEDKSTDARLNHCFHIYESLTTSDGFNDIAKSVGNYRDSSAIKVRYRYNPLSFNQLVTSFLTDENFYKAGAWYCLRFPYPFSTHNSVATKGLLYGNNATKKDPVTIDSKNMHFTHSGNVGYNNSEAEDFGAINSVNFFIRHEWVVNMSGSGDKTIFAGDFKYRCALYDTAGNIVISDFNVPFNNVWEPISLNLESFAAYRARTNIGLGNLRSTLIPLGIEVLNRFDWENIAMISVQWQEPYDDEGRYAPEGSRVINSPLAQYAIETAAGGGIPNHTDVNLYIDGFHFGKTMLSVSDPITTGRAIEPPVEHFNWIDNKYQLDQARDAYLQIHQFRQNRWNIGMEGRLDINFGDSFFLEDDQLVNRSDRNATQPDGNDGDPNTIKLVAKKIIHRIDKPATGIGGFITKIDAAKRFEGVPDN